jgi:hypothetical protein
MKLPPGARMVGHDIVFPCRGIPPKLDIPGYVQDPSDDFRWVLAYQPCKYRTLGVRVKCPLGSKVVDTCSLIGLYVSPGYCQTCTKREI